jgi:hypothetical protein
LGRRYFDREYILTAIGIGESGACSFFHRSIDDGGVEDLLLRIEIPNSRPVSELDLEHFFSVVGLASARWTNFNEIERTAIIELVIYGIQQVTGFNSANFNYNKKWLLSMLSKYNILQELSSVILINGDPEL